MSSFPINSRTLSWLNCILNERFGNQWKLEKDKYGISLKLLGSEGLIFFDDICINFYEAKSDLPFTLWDAQFEGWHSALDKPIPCPGFKNLKKPLIEKKRNKYLVHYDILGLTYWMLARVEEINRLDLDIHQRFPARSSHAYKNRYLDRPVVDEWLHILAQVIKKQWPGIKLLKHDFQMIISHDVDTASRYSFTSPKKFVKRISGDLLRGNFKNALSAPLIRNNKSKLSSLDPYNTFDWIMDQSEKNFLKSSFYFITGKTSSMEGEYDIEHPFIKYLLKRINSRGHEIGIHPSYNSFKDPILIKRELDLLKTVTSNQEIEQSSWGGRMHYLRWKHPYTLRALNEAGLSYDSTLVYNDQVGFRCGTCFEFNGFDPIRSEQLSIRVRPLIVMEVTLFAKKYMGLQKEDGLKTLLNLKNKCQKLNGQFTLLWHNSNLLGLEDHYLKIFS